MGAPTPVTPPTPVGARYSPNTSRSVAVHSPTVTPARAHSSEAGIRLSDVRAVSASSLRAASTLASSRPARHALTAAPAADSTAGSITRIAVSRSASSGFGSEETNLLTPTTTSSPDSTRARRAACEDTRADFM